MHSRQSPATAPVIDPDLEASSSRLRPYEPAVERLIAYEGSRNCFQTDPESEPVFVGNSSASSLLRSVSTPRTGLTQAAEPLADVGPRIASRCLPRSRSEPWRRDGMDLFDARLHLGDRFGLDHGDDARPADLSSVRRVVGLSAIRSRLP